MLKRIFDIICSVVALIVLSPLFLIFSILILIDSEGPVFYKQSRVGRNGRDFILFKFRTMCKDAHKDGLITVGDKDGRITRTGYYLRKYKLDELPQLINILSGTMSIVGPRPEVKKYVDLYTPEQRKVLLVRPGLTDFASLQYINEHILLGNASDPEQTYINEIMPAKLRLNLSYIEKQSFIVDLKIILKTVAKILKRH
jgi:lipopolysaccharide/colanic/teichoic acid biosynthesis glycosyltransferase